MTKFTSTFNSFQLKRDANLSILESAVPTEAGHHSGHSVRVGQHVADGHLVEPGVPEGDDGGATSTMASLVVVVVDKDEGVAIGHESPSLSPAPANGEQLYLQTTRCGRAATTQLID